jgi:small nuclear ribonucleoprotein (snRNP)-like protein|eukprot:scaffold1917_cov196-Alexandrium_tamarense.AAC.18
MPSTQHPSATASKPSTKAQPSSSAATDLAPLLRHFVGIDLIIETKHGRTFKGRLQEADAYMNLVLSRKPPSFKPNQQAFATAEGVDITDAKHFDFVHIRGPTIRYIAFGSNVDIVGVIRAGRDRERAAGDKYKRGIRKS